MAKVDLPYIFQPSARGKRYTYYRRGKERVRLPDPSDRFFHAEYQRVHQQFEAESKRTGAAPGSLSWLIQQYRTDPKYKKKAQSTRLEYDRFLNEMVRRFGSLPYRRITIRFLYELRDEKAEAPGMANLRLRVMLALLNWAVKRGHLDRHPAPKGIEWLELEGEGAEPWSDHDIAAVKAVAAPEVGFLIDLTVGTGQRRADVVKMDHLDIKNGYVRVIQQKTDEDLWIPLHPELADSVKNLSHDTGPLARPQRGRRYTPTNASQAVKRAAKAAGVGHLSIHGLRKTATIRLAEAGCSDMEIQSVTGHATAEMVRKYARKLNQPKLAKQAMDRLSVKQADDDCKTSRHESA